MNELTEEQCALVVEHMHYAQSVAAKYRYRLKFYPSLDVDDLHAAAHLGLCLAAQRFDASRAVEFKTVCFMWVQKTTRRLFQEHNRQTGWAWRTPRAVARAQGSSERSMHRMLERVAWPRVGDGHNEKDADFAAPGVCFEAAIAYKEQLAIAFDSLDRWQDKMVLSLRLTGMTHEDIGARIGITKSSVWEREKVIIKRANKALGVHQ